MDALLCAWRGRVAHPFLALDRASGIGWAMPAVTGGQGLHIVLRMPTGVEAKQSAGALGVGLDVRVGSKGYIVVAPS